MEYTEIPEEEEYIEDDLGFGDVMLFASLAFVICIAVTYVIKVFSKSFKNVNLKIGDKINIGIESNNDK